MRKNTTTIMSVQACCPSSLAALLMTETRMLIRGRERERYEARPELCTTNHIEDTF